MSMSMSSTSRRSRILAAALATALLAALTGTSPAATARPAAAERAPAGPMGGTIPLQDQVSLSGLDVALDAAGTAYVGWIGDPMGGASQRAVHFCVLPHKAQACQGGVQTISAIDGPSAAGLQVEVSGAGQGQLVWFHQSGLTSAKLASAPFSGGVLSAGSDVADAPSNGLLFDVVRHPDGQLWALTRSDSGNARNLQVLPGLGTPQAVTAPWSVGAASLAFAGSKPVVLASEAGQISARVHAATGAPWGSFRPVPGTWNLGGFHDAVTTSRGLRMVASEDNANYRPVVAKWKGDAFGKARLVGENKSCPALTFDLRTDGSGRLSNVSERCGKLGIYNHPVTTKAAIDYFSTGGTVAGAPQIDTIARGYGLVAWPILSPSGVATKLQARWVRLPSLLKAKGAKKKGNKVTVKAPVGCLTPVTVKAVVKAKPARGWKVVSRSLKLDGKAQGVDVKINGEQLATGSKHVLLGKGVFRKGGQKVTVKKKVTFKVC